ncbi:MAG: 1-acyl-sn-glycerol-3-phosphate acyltransferase [Alphaproteobacteria bacterium]|nr:1-acyl-sn-glycerol-3-phosphate acyltransferase [Alphaproteobacteria bacterium]
MSKARFLWRAGLIVLGLFVCVPLHYGSRLLGGSRWPRRFLRWAAYASGMRVRSEGEPLHRHVLFLANHLSWLDILVLAGASGTAFVSKDDVARWPVVGWLARLNNTVFIARSSRAAVRHQADALREALARGQPVALFPEGTTEGGMDILPFRGSLLAALFPPLPGVQVQAVALDYGDAGHDIAWIGEESAPDNARRILSRKGSVPVTVRFLARIDPGAAGDRKVLAERARVEIVEALGGAPSGAAADRL